MTERKAPFRHGVEFTAYCVATTVGAALPERVTEVSGAAIGRLAGSVLRVRRGDTDRHLAIAFPDRSASWRRRTAARSYAHLGREAAALAKLVRLPPAEVASMVDLVGFDAVRDAAAKGGGVILLTAHLGNWELAGAAIAASGIALDVVGKGMANERFERELFARRERLGMRMIEMSEAPKRVLRSLAEGRLVAMLGDQNAHRNGVFVPFFGRPAATSRGPALFAIRAGAPVFVGFAVREDGPHPRYTLEAIPLPVERSADTERDVVSMLESYHSVLEGAIRGHPEQYFWQHRRWRTRPSEELPPRR